MAVAKGSNRLQFIFENIYYLLHLYSISFVKHFWRIRLFIKSVIIFHITHKFRGASTSYNAISKIKLKPNNQ